MALINKSSKELPMESNLSVETLSSAVLGNEPKICFSFDLALVLFLFF